MTLTSPCCNSVQDDFRAFLNAHFQPQAGPPVTNGDKPAAGAADPFEAELAAAAVAAGSAIEMAGVGGAGGAISQKPGSKPRKASVRDKARARAPGALLLWPRTKAFSNVITAALAQEADC